MANKKMTEQEKREWDILYKYFKTAVMGYDNNQSLSSNMVLRLKGLRTGKFIENTKIEDVSNYSFRLILDTIIDNKQAIEYASSNVQFKNETHKFNYILKIIESKLNDSYKKKEEEKRLNEKIDKIDLKIISGNNFNDYSDYSSKKPISNSNKNEDRMKDWW